MPRPTWLVVLFAVEMMASIAERTETTLPYTTWNEERVRATLKAKGLDVTGRDGSLHVYDPFDYDVQIANAVQENAFRRGA